MTCIQWVCVTRTQFFFKKGSICLETTHCWQQHHSHYIGRTHQTGYQPMYISHGWLVDGVEITHSKLDSTHLFHSQELWLSPATVLVVTLLISPRGHCFSYSALFKTYLKMHLISNSIGVAAPGVRKEWAIMCQGVYVHLPHNVALFAAHRSNENATHVLSGEIAIFSPVILMFHGLAGNPMAWLGGHNKGTI